MELRSIFGERELFKFDPQELTQINDAELDLFGSIDTSFAHFNKWKQTLMSSIPNEVYIRLCHDIVVDIFRLFWSVVHPEVSVAVAAVGRVENGSNPSGCNSMVQSSS
jgi:hypothetical protein